MSPSSFIYAWIYINFVIGLVEGGISSEMFIKEEYVISKLYDDPIFPREE